jgi:hypothetical protein
VEKPKTSCVQSNNKDIPQEWIKNYVDALINLSKELDVGGPMHEACLLRADYVMDLVKAFRESK